MKLEPLFKKFLKDTVNLDQTRFDTATNGINTITDFLKSNEDLKDYFVSATPQGSYRQKTITRPVSEEYEFDVDLLYEMKIAEGWEAEDYLGIVAQAFRETDRYKDLVDIRNKSRCVTIDYESDFHIDVVPAIKTNAGYLIMNKKTNQFEPTDGDGYAAWFEGKSSITDGFLVEAVRLIKYIRDVKEKFSAKSILLTTLLGNQIYSGDDKATLYSDLPTALSVVVNRLDTYLQTQQSMPTVNNPVLPTENFNRHWDEEKFSTFKEAIHDLNAKINDAYSEDDEEESIKKWRLVFGDEFPGEELGKSAEGSVVTRDPGEQFLSDFNIPTRLQHRLKINANVIQNGFRPFLLLGSLNPLKKWRSLEFIIEECTATHPYDIMWKIKNYGEEAARIDQLRGEIIRDGGRGVRKESTRYEGKHYVECYIIKDGICVAQDRIYVPIGQF